MKSYLKSTSSTITTSSTRTSSTHITSTLSHPPTLLSPIHHLEEHLPSTKSSHFPALISISSLYNSYEIQKKRKKMKIVQQSSIQSVSQNEDHYRCLCNKIFRRKNSLLYHIRDKHGKLTIESQLYSHVMHEYIRNNIKRQRHQKETDEYIDKIRKNSCQQFLSSNQCHYLIALLPEEFNNSLPLHLKQTLNHNIKNIIGKVQKGDAQVLSLQIMPNQIFKAKYVHIFKELAIDYIKTFKRNIHFFIKNMNHQQLTLYFYYVFIISMVEMSKEQHISLSSTLIEAIQQYLKGIDIRHEQVMKASVDWSDVLVFDLEWVSGCKVQQLKKLKKHWLDVNLLNNGVKSELMMLFLNTFIYFLQSFQQQQQSQKK